MLRQQERGEILLEVLGARIEDRCTWLLYATFPRILGLLASTLSASSWTWLVEPEVVHLEQVDHSLLHLPLRRPSVPLGILSSELL